MDSLEQLQSLLHLCTARVTDPKNPNERGTGFFVAPGFILTCAHVVENAHSSKMAVSVQWAGQSYIAKIGRFRDKPYPDLALLKIDDLTNHPCVYLHQEVRVGDDLYSYGYTDKYPDGDPTTFVCEGSTNEPQPLLKFKFGEVRAGLSGGPLLNQRTGGVCGVVKRTRGTDTVMGGRAIPISTVFREFQELKELQEQFHQQNRQWYDSLMTEQRKVLGIEEGVPKNAANAVEIFYSYVEEDKDMAERLQKHLILLKRQELITDWHSGKLAPGEKPSEQIKKHLDTAKIILLLISQDFMFSEHHDTVEVKRAMERHNKDAIVIPVLLRPTNDLDKAPFGKLLAIPRNHKPISKWSDKDEAFVEVAREIREVVERLRLPNP